MEKQKLPNDQVIMLLGLVSYIGCCCTNGFLGVVISGVGLYLANKSIALYKANPDTYNLGSVTTWKIVNLIALILSIITVIVYLYLVFTGKADEMQKEYMKILEQYQK